MVRSGAARCVRAALIALGPHDAWLQREHVRCARRR